jgi:predicted nucleotidyltransferase
MLAPQDERVVRELKRRFEAIAPIKNLVVFGSRARGDFSGDSDLDIFLELEEVTPVIRRQIREIAWEISLEEEIVVSTFVASSQAMVNSPLAANPILQAIKNEGVAI